jgi:hypothetical protein
MPDEQVGQNKLKDSLEDLYVSMTEWEAYAIAREMVRLAIDECRRGKRELASVVTDAIDRGSLELRVQEAKAKGKKK